LVPESEHPGGDRFEQLGAGLPAGGAEGSGGLRGGLQGGVDIGQRGDPEPAS
jgi:hypothetical protein